MYVLADHEFLLMSLARGNVRLRAGTAGPVGTFSSKSIVVVVLITCI